LRIAQIEAIASPLIWGDACNKRRCVGAFLWLSASGCALADATGFVFAD
jgi:hypothetical protein